MEIPPVEHSNTGVAHLLLSEVLPADRVQTEDLRWVEGRTTGADIRGVNTADDAEHALAGGDLDGDGDLAAGEPYSDVPENDSGGV